MSHRELYKAVSRDFVKCFHSLLLTTLPRLKHTFVFSKTDPCSTLYPLRTMDSHAQPRGLALCSANRPVYSILPRNASGTPGQPYEASEPIVAHVTKAIDICRLMLIQPDVLHAFHEIVWRYDVQNEKCWCFERNATTNEEVTRTFISKIVLAFPLVFVDYTLNNPDSKGFHTRRPWDGDFEPGHQSISINGKVDEAQFAF